MQRLPLDKLGPREVAPGQVHFGLFLPWVSAAERLRYLADLGINCIEVMPITNVEATLNWGFEPIGYFGVDERLATGQISRSLLTSRTRTELP